MEGLNVQGADADRNALVPLVCNLTDVRQRPRIVPPATADDQRSRIDQPGRSPALGLPGKRGGYAYPGSSGFLPRFSFLSDRDKRPQPPPDRAAFRPCRNQALFDGRLDKQ